MHGWVHWVPSLARTHDPRTEEHNREASHADLSDLSTDSKHSLRSCAFVRDSAWCGGCSRGTRSLRVFSRDADAAERGCSRGVCARSSSGSRGRGDAGSCGAGRGEGVGRQEKVGQARPRTPCCSRSAPATPRAPENTAQMHLALLACCPSAFCRGSCASSASSVLTSVDFQRLECAAPAGPRSVVQRWQCSHRIKSAPPCAPATAAGSLRKMGSPRRRPPRRHPPHRRRRRLSRLRKSSRRAELLSLCPPFVHFRAGALSLATVACPAGQAMPLLRLRAKPVCPVSPLC